MLSLFLLTIFGAVIAAIIGTLWYSNKTPMGRIHMKYLGFDKLSPDEQKERMEKGKKMMPKMYAGQMILSILTSFAVVFVVLMSMRNGVSFTLALGFVIFNWLCFMVPIIGSGILWSNCDRTIVWKKFFSDIFANLVTLIVVAFIASFFA